jgi:hypothetical protein
VATKLLPAVLFCVGGVGAAWAAFEARDRRADEAAEPERSYTLHLNDQAIELQPGQTLRVAGEFENPELRLDVGPTRHFRYGQMAFDYPANFVWEADLSDPSLKMWTMDGADLSLMVFRSSFGYVSQEFAESVADQFEDPEFTDIEHVFGGETITGTRLEVEIAGTLLIYEAYDVPVDVGGAILIVMDATDTGLHTEEYATTMELLSETLRFGDQLVSAREQELLEEIADVRQQIEVFEVTYTDDQPILKELRERLTKLEAALAELRADER